jgi:hypothetical protein
MSKPPEGFDCVDGCSASRSFAVARRDCFLDVLRDLKPVGVAFDCARVVDILLILVGEPGF